MRGSIAGLYVIADPDACRGRSPVDVAARALEGGASLLQWRDKRRDKGSQLADARAIRELCGDHGALFIINDHADLAIAVEADGVHVGQHDLPVDLARRIVGPDLYVGASTNNVEEALRAEADGADYVALGSIFPTGSKEVTRPASLDRLREIKAAVHVPVVAIGGIDASNVADVIAAGADAAAVISAVCAADDPAAAARSLAAAFRGTPPSRARGTPESAVGENATRNVVARYAEALDRRDRDAFLALFHIHAAHTDPIGERSRIGRREIGAWWDRAVALWPHFALHPREVFVCGREAAMVWTIEERDDGGHRREFAGVDIVRLDANGLIVSVDAYWERASLSEWE